MYELLDKYENRGENRMAQLIQKLLGSHRKEDLLKAAETLNTAISYSRNLGLPNQFSP